MDRPRRHDDAPPACVMEFEMPPGPTTEPLYGPTDDGTIADFSSSWSVDVRSGKRRTAPRLSVPGGD